MANTFIMPNKIISGENALNSAIQEFSMIGKKALLVTDSIMNQLGNVKKLVEILNKAGLEVTVFDEVNSEPTDIIVDSGVKKYNENECDCLVAIGGGSPIDTMKAIAMLVTCKGKAADYMGQTVTEKLPVMAAIPTTAGTGSEATQFTIITDTKTDIKMLLKGPALMPNLAIIDPQFTITAPKKITAATGVDALTHAIEAYTSKKAQPMSDIFALSAVKRIFKNLKTAFDCPSDVEARNEMAIAALEAGIAFNNSSVTIVHGMSRPIGALFHVPHGVSNAMLLGTCLRYVKDGATSRFADLARACELLPNENDDEILANCFIDKVIELLKNIEIPTLLEYGIDKDKFETSIEKMAKDAFDSGSPSNTRKAITIKDMEYLYYELWNKEK